MKIISAAQDAMLLLVGHGMLGEICTGDEGWEMKLGVIDRGSKRDSGSLPRTHFGAFVCRDGVGRGCALVHVKCSNNLC